MRRRAALACFVLPLFMAPSLSALAAEAHDREEIETIVREYLLREPELLMEVLAALEEKRGAQAQEQQREAIAAAGPELTSSPPGTVLGNPDGDVTIVEFFDYNCGFCRRALADMQALIEGDPELRVILKESPVLGPPSEAATRVSLAVRQIEPERYAEFHERLLTSEGTADEAQAIRVAATLGIDSARVQEAMNLPEVSSALQESARLLAALSITGTPSYVVGGELVPGAVGAEALAGRIANVRECGKATC